MKDLKEVKDPYGKEIQAYEDVFDQLERITIEFFGALLGLLA